MQDFTLLAIKQCAEVEILYLPEQIALLMNSTRLQRRSIYFALEVGKCFDRWATMGS